MPFPPGGGPALGNGSLSQGGAPPEVWLVAVGLVALAGILLYPVVRYGFPLLPHIFSSNSFERAISDLVLMVFAEIGACGVALLALARGLVRGQRVARLLTIVVGIIVAVAEIAAAEQPGGYDSGLTGNGTVIAIALIVLAVVVLLSVTPGSRTHFRQDGQPIGVMLAAAINAFVGTALLICAVLLLLAGAEGAAYTWIGLGYAVVGIAMILTVRRLREGSTVARNITFAVDALLVVLALIEGNELSSMASPVVLIPLGMAISSAVGLALPESSKAHFAGMTA